VSPRPRRISRFTPTTAAFEGFRLIRREPVAALVWMLLWLVALLSTAILVASGKKVVLVAAGEASRDIADRFGPFTALCVMLFLLVWVTTSLATYRAVLRPDERRFFYLRLGADEMRLAIMTVVSFFAVLLLGGVPAYLLLVLADPLMRALPHLARDIGAAGAWVTVCVDVWLGVRLSLISVETFAERRFHLSAYWPLTKGRFWYLFFCYFLCFVLLFAFSVLLYVIGGLITAVAQPDLGSGPLWLRTGVLGLAAVLALLTAAFWVMSSVIFCACQAHAFRAIISDGKAGVAIS
jgi:hypothetical protein